MSFRLFVDGSCEPNSKIGYGAMLLVAARENRSLGELQGEVKVKRFEPCGSSSLELKTLLWAFSLFLECDGGPLVVHTDSQTIIGLPERRASLEVSGFCSRRGKPLGMAGLYREFYDALDSLNLTFVKQKGHGPARGKTREDLLFSLVDRVARSALRAGRG